MTGCTAVSQCGHTANRPGDYSPVVSRTVGSVTNSCKVVSGVHFFLCRSILSRHENTPESLSWIWPLWIHFPRVSLLNIGIKFENELFHHYR